MGSTVGPYVLTSWKDMPDKMSVKDKKEFWAARRRAVGGPSLEDGSEESNADDDDDDAAPGAADIELPAVGEGRGAKQLSDDSIQPIAYHMLPVNAWTNLIHGAGTTITIR